MSRDDILAEDPYRASDARPAVCPHCGASVGCKRHRQLRLVCEACGMPRIPGACERDLSPIALAQLVRARRRFRLERFGWWLRCALLVLAFWAAIVGEFHGAGVHGVLFLGLCVVTLGIRGWRKQSLWYRSLDSAWVVAAMQLASTRGGRIRPRDLANETGVSEKDAEAIVAQLPPGAGFLE